MNIQIAHIKLKELIASSPRQNLQSKYGIKTDFYNNFVEILHDSNISYVDENLVEIKWRILNIDFSDKFCKNCGANVEFVSLYKGFRKYCSTTCSAIDRDNITRSGWVNKEGYDKSRDTLWQRYGVRHQMHDPEIFDRQQCSRYKTYSIWSPSNKEYRVQGYERYVIPELWNTYAEEDIIVAKKDLPKIHYDYGDKLKKYYPDCYIKSTNNIIEVKSTYTIKSPELPSKLQSCVFNGYTPTVYLYDKGVIHILSLAALYKYLNI